MKGKGKGKRLGFPTVNVKLLEKIESGVYAGSIRIGDKDYKAGIFVSPDRKMLEAHLIGFSGDLRGEMIEVRIEKKIRNVMKFERDEELKEQIADDLQVIRNLPARFESRSESGG